MADRKAKCRHRYCYRRVMFNKDGQPKIPIEIHDVCCNKNCNKDFGVRGTSKTSKIIPMLLWCPECGERHIDEGEFATRSHATHACQNCGMVWRPALVPTVGVRFLPGYSQ